jgi:NADPH2:quinone reductase
VRAAQVHELGSVPQAVEIDDADGLEVTAVALNPLDLAVAAGRFYGGHPPLPYVIGCEAAARVDGRRLYLFGDGRGTAKDGFLAERVSFPRELGVEIPDGVDDATAAAAGIAGLAGWIPVTRRSRVRPGDRVLVLGATGTVGRVAVQAAKLLGADRVTAAGRDEQGLRRALELGADAVHRLGEPYDEQFDLIVDPLWGDPLQEALDAAAPNARVVHIGQSAGPEATLTSAAVRGKQLSILGHSNFVLDAETRAEAYSDLLAHVARGEVQIDHETFPLDRVAEAWAAQTAATKAVVVF